MDRAPYVSFTGAPLEVKIEAYTLLVAPEGAWSTALNFFRCACSSLPSMACGNGRCVSVNPVVPPFSRVHLNARLTRVQLQYNDSEHHLTRRFSGSNDRDISPTLFSSWRTPSPASRAWATSVRPA